MSVFYDKLARLLRKLSLTQTQFSKDIGMNKNQMSIFGKRGNASSYNFVQNRQVL